jgi:hypothetical protein
MGTRAETMAETADLKSLARRLIERDRARDTGRDRPGSDCLAAELASRRPLETAPLPRSLNEQDYDTAIPEPYALSIAALERRCPDHVDTADWQQAMEDGRRFLRRWGQQAATIGWTARDLFGLPHIPEKVAELPAALPVRRNRARRPASATADQVRASGQPQDCEGARPRDAGSGARPRRRGDRVTDCNRRLAALHPVVAPDCRAGMSTFI